MQTHVYHITYEPETQAAHLLFRGCNMHCRGCIRKLHLWDSHLSDSGEPGRAAKPNVLTSGEVLELLPPGQVRRIFFFGDEPSTDPALGELAVLLRERFGAQHVLLTNGMVPAPYELFDEVHLSIKAVTPDLHRDFTGVNPAPVMEALRRLHQANVNLSTESIVIPQYVAADEIGRVAAFISSVDPDIPYRLDAYIPVPDAPWNRPTPQAMEDAASAARRHLRHVSTLHGRTGPQHKIVRLV